MDTPSFDTFSASPNRRGPFPSLLQNSWHCKPMYRRIPRNEVDCVHVACVFSKFKDRYSLQYNFEYIHGIIWMYQICELQLNERLFVSSVDAVSLEDMYTSKINMQNLPNGLVALERRRGYHHPWCKCGQCRSYRHMRAPGWIIGS